MKSAAILLCLASFLGLLNQACASSAMKRLYEELFTDYNRLILPVANNKTKVTVTLGLKLGQILDLNLKQQILSTNVWVEQTWHDYKLQWDPEMYGGIDMIHVPAENIWIPDIVLFNNADGNYELTLVAKARLYSNGTVVWKPPTMFRSTCEIDVEHFPFDIQTCYLRFGSWTYAGDELELRHPGNKSKNEIGIDLSQFYKNVEWDIIDVPAYYNENYYECCTEPYPDITFKIVIRRKMLFYLVNLILPVALMTFMTVSVFYLPADSNEKVTLSISILTSLIVFFLLMLEIIPASSLAVPLFGKYLLFTLVLVSLSACVSVYVLNLHHRSPAVHSMSPRMRQLFLKTLPRILGLNRPDPRERSSLNRFRKKKIAQQMFQASSANKVYDLAQPLAASLNLIETLHKSYEFNANDDDDAAKKRQQNDDNDDDDGGRYFRKYVDNYIEQMKKRRDQEAQSIKNENPAAVAAAATRADDACNCKMLASQKSTPRTRCSEHRKCCSYANQPFKKLINPMQASNDGSFRRFAANNNAVCCNSAAAAGLGATMDWTTEASSDMVCPLEGPMNNEASLRSARAAHSMVNSCRGIPSQNCTAGRCLSHAGLVATAGAGGRAMINDDTFDMTFDYDDQHDSNHHRAPLSKSKLSHAEDDLPSPPPPPRQLTQLSDTIQSKSGRCSRNQTLNSSDESSNEIPDSSLMDHGHLVDKLINSINMINNASEDIDTTTTSNNDVDDDYEHKPIIDYSGRNLMQGTNYSTSHNRANLIETREQQSFEVAANQSQIRQSRLIKPELTIDDELRSKCTCHPIESNINATNLAAQESICQGPKQPSDLLLSLRLSYDQMPAHVRAAIRSILFIADTIKNEDDENSAIEDWESLSMVVDRVFLWIFFLMCSLGSIIILAMAPSLYDTRESIDDKLRIDVPPSNCSASVYAH